MNSKEYKALSRKEFDAAAEKFDDNSPSVYNMCRKDYPDILAEIEREDFTDVLDCGCGTGAMIELLSQKYPDKRYTGLDLSEKMIQVANRRKRDNMTFVVGDCEEIPFQDESFEVVLCSMSFHHYPDPERFFRNVFRVLRPGGRLILRDMTGAKLICWLENHLMMPIANHLLHKGDVKMYGREDVEALCRASGLVLERFEHRKGMRLHAVCRKAKSEREQNPWPVGNG